MMTYYFAPASIKAQIKDTEQKILNHQRALDSQADALAGKIQQQMVVKPANLILAGSIGFIVGELTKKHCGTTDNPHATEISPLKTAQSLIGSVRTLYAVLPLVLMIKSCYQADELEQSMKANDAK